jgi:hypothetical protein
MQHHRIEEEADVALTAQAANRRGDLCRSVEQHDELKSLELDFPDKSMQLILVVNVLAAPLI